jgi:hypothetical protein
MRVGWSGLQKILLAEFFSGHACHLRRQRSKGSRARWARYRAHFARDPLLLAATGGINGLRRTQLFVIDNM